MVPSGSWLDCIAMNWKYRILAMTLGTLGFGAECGGVAGVSECTSTDQSQECRDWRVCAGACARLAADGDGCLEFTEGAAEACSQFLRPS